MTNAPQSGDPEASEKLWLLMGIGLGTAAAIAFGFWARSRKGLPTPSVQHVLDQCRETVSILDESLAAIEAPVKHVNSN